MSTATLAAFIAYFVIVLAVGWYCCRKNESIEDYLLGGRRMGALVTAISAEASDMSGWLLMGLPGAIYLGGMKNIWIAVGIFLGTILNWVLVVWKQVGLGEHMYEIVPGFVANSFAIWVTNRIVQQQDGRVLQQFEEVSRAMRNRKMPASSGVASGPAGF